MPRMTIDYEQTEDFTKDFKKLRKRYRTLEEDLNTAKTAAIELFHLQAINNSSVFPIPGFCTPEIQVSKLKKFACRALKGKGAKSGIRVIYAFYPNSFRVVFLEMYFKADQENETKQRIKAYLDTV